MAPSRALRGLAGTLAAIVTSPLVAGCGSKPPVGAAIFVRIERGSGVSTCVQVTVSTEGRALANATKTFNAEGTVSLGVLQESTETEVEVTAVGGQGTACTPTTPAERATKTFAFPATGVSNEVLTLERSGSDGGTMDGGLDGGDDAGIDGGGGLPDAGNDGGASDGGVDGGPPDAGGMDGGFDGGPIDLDHDGSPAGVDCDDNDARRFPGNPEVCSGGIDEDCDLAVDCAQQPLCANATCGTGTAGAAQCQGTSCVELNCGNGLDDDLDGPSDCADSNCTNRPCMGLGTCVGTTCQQPVETACGDGQDNDGDNAIDCADADCVGQPCTDQLSCSLGDRCVGTTCVPTTSVTCQSPPTSCFTPTGLCTEPDAGCAYTPDPTLGCNDNTRCTTNDQCLTDGGCRGTRVTCTQSADVCTSTQGTCVEADGGCAFTPLSNTPCEDGNPCTLGDTCQVGACQSGAQVACTTGECQYLGSQCLGDGGCDVRNHDAGVSCGAGTCDGLGACRRFPYAPSNFDETVLPRDAGAPIVVTCTATFAVTDSAVLSTGCAVPVPPFVIVPQAGAPSLVLFHAPSMTITDGGSLTLTGTQPIAFAITGNIDISGALDVSGATSSGPGADDLVACANGFGLDGGTNGFPDGGGSPRGGGSGGSFGLVGGTGGSPGSGSNLGGAASAANGTLSLIPLRGGCRGGNGGGVRGPGEGGAAGGAIQLSAAGSLTVAGRVTSVGRGGGGADQAAEQPLTGPGGGGGGSGGAILLEGNLVHVTGHVSTNGGGGGEGRASQAGQGSSGAAGSPFSTTNASGGTGGSSGGNGGRGGARAGDATGGQSGQSTSAGGGGGGGSVGRIRVNSVLPCTGTAQTMSPQANSTQSACTF